MADVSKPDSTPPVEPATPEPPAASEKPLGEAGLKALHAEREARKVLESRLKELEPLAAKARELEEASKTETQKATDRAEVAERRTAELESRLARADVAAAKGLPPSLAVRLVGTTREELEADADELAKLLPPATTEPPPLPHGYGTKPPAKTVDGNEWLRSKARGR